MKKKNHPAPLQPFAVITVFLRATYSLESKLGNSAFVTTAMDDTRKDQRRNVPLHVRETRKRCAGMVGEIVSTELVCTKTCSRSPVYVSQYSGTPI